MVEVCRKTEFSFSFIGTTPASFAPLVHAVPAFDWTSGLLVVRLHAITWVNSTVAVEVRNVSVTPDDPSIIFGTGATGTAAPPTAIGAVTFTGASAPAARRSPWSGSGRRSGRCWRSGSGRWASPPERFAPPSRSSSSAGTAERGAGPMTGVAVYFDASESALGEAFTQLHAEGYRMQSISLFGPRSQPIYAGLWHQTWGPGQTLLTRIPLGELDAVVAAHRQALMFPALVSGAHGPDPILAIVFEQGPSIGDPSGPPGARLHPVMLKPTTWQPFSQAIYSASLALYVRSVAVIGPRRNDAGKEYDPAVLMEPESDRVQANTALLYTATFWPQPLGRSWVYSGVRLSTSAPDWRWQWSNMVMRNHSEPVAVVGAPSANEHPEPVLTLWHDAMHEPWPEPDPFAFDPMKQGERHRADREGASTVASRFALRVGQQELPLSLTAHGETIETAVWNTVWAPRSAHQTLPRKFLRVGPGDGSDRLDPDGDVVRSFSVLPSGITHAGQKIVRDLADLYEEVELRPGHVRVVPRFPGAPSSTVRNMRPGPPPGGPHPTDDGWDLERMPAGPSLDGLHATADDLEPAAMPSLGSSIEWHPFDRTMFDLMKRGARSAYLVVLRRGELKFARTYTMAEEGYPIARLHHRFRVSSVSKPILATLLLRQAELGWGSLGDKLADALEVVPQFPQLARATLDDAIRHATGLATTYKGPPDYFTLLNYANQTQGLTYLKQLGTMRNWYATYDDPAGVPFQEHQVALYNNWVYSCLGEVYGKRSRRRSYASWPWAIGDALGLAGATTEYALGGQSYSDCLENSEVPYHSRPALGPRIWPEDKEPLPFTAVPYGQAMDTLGASTSIVISPLDMARFLAAMTPRAGKFHWLSPQQLPRLHSPAPGLPGNDGLGWGFQGYTWQTLHGGVPVNRPMVRMGHNGGLTGTAAWICHLKTSLVGTGVAALEEDTLSFAMAFNTEIPSTDGGGSEILQAAQAIELAGKWPVGDLFHDL